MNDPRTPEQTTPARWRPQYGFQTLATLTAIVAIASTVFAGLVRRDAWWPVYDFLACAAPTLLLILVVAAQSVARRLARRPESLDR